MTNLSDALAALARKRASMKAVEAEYKHHAKERSDLEVQVRELALEEYAERGESWDVKGVEVRMTKRVEGTDTPEMLAWCHENARHLLSVSINTRQASKEANHLAEVGAPLKVTKEPQVRIASDLSMWEDV